MNYILIGNIIALLASLVMICSGLLKNKKQILYVQTIEIMLFTFSNIILGGISGALVNVLNCIRNILCYKNKLNIIAKFIITFLACVLTFSFNNLGFIGLFPLFGSVIYLWLMDLKDIVMFKLLIIFVMILWVVHDLFIKSYSSSFFSVLNIIANVFSIIKIKLGKNVYVAKH